MGQEKNILESFVYKLVLGLDWAEYGIMIEMGR